MRVETALAESHVTRQMRRKPELNYHKIAVSDLPRAVAPFDWAFILSRWATGLDSLNVSQVEPVKAAVGLIASEPLEVLQDYLSWKVIDSAAGI